MRRIPEESVQLYSFFPGESPEFYQQDKNVSFFCYGSRCFPLHCCLGINPIPCVQETLHDSQHHRIKKWPQIDFNIIY